MARINRPFFNNCKLTDDHDDKDDVDENYKEINENNPDHTVFPENSPH
jgi:hypothetical protein